LEPTISNGFQDTITMANVTQWLTWP